VDGDSGSCLFDGIGWELWELFEMVCGFLIIFGSEALTGMNTGVSSRTADSFRILFSSHWNRTRNPSKNKKCKSKTPVDFNLSSCHDDV
jgi:hypothetical protein